MKCYEVKIEYSDVFNIKRLSVLRVNKDSESEAIIEVKKHFSLQDYFRKVRVLNTAKLIYANENTFSSSEMIRIMQYSNPAPTVHFIAPKYTHIKMN